MSAVSTYGQSINTQIETRRASLEAFLSSAVEAVMIAAGNEMSGAIASRNAQLALQLTQQFLDDDSSKLLVVQPQIKRANVDDGLI